MYNHDVHKSMTHFFFMFLSISVFFVIVPATIENVNEYTYMFSFIFSLIGQFCFREIYIPIQTKVKGTGFTMSLYRYCFIFIGFMIGIGIVFGCKYNRC
jgi:hypothetical protein